MSSPPRSPRICVTATSGPPDRGLALVQWLQRGFLDAGSFPVLAGSAFEAVSACAVLPVSEALATGATSMSGKSADAALCAKRVAQALRLPRARTHATRTQRILRGIEITRL